MSEAAAAKVEVKNRIPDGIYQIVFTNLIKGDTVFLQMFYATPERRNRSSWNDGCTAECLRLISEEVISQFFFTGEHLAVTNFGSIPLQGFADQNSGYFKQTSQPFLRGRQKPAYDASPPCAVTAKTLTKSRKSLIARPYAPS